MENIYTTANNSLQRRLSWVNLENLYRHQRIWKKICLGMYRGMRDQTSGFNKQEFDFVPKSWKIQTAGRPLPPWLLELYRYAIPPSGCWHALRYKTARSIVCLGTLIPTFLHARRACNCVTVTEPSSLRVVGEYVQPPACFTAAPRSDCAAAVNLTAPLRTRLMRFPRPVVLSPSTP